MRVRQTIAVVAALITAGLFGLFASPATAQDDQTDTTDSAATQDDQTDTATDGATAEDDQSDTTETDTTEADTTETDTTEADTDGAAAEINIPVSEAYAMGGAEGDTVAAGSAAVDASLQGRSCEVVATITNQSSVHVGNTLVVTSGDSTVTITNIEDEADATVTNGGTITLGETISASVVLGPDGATSLGSSLDLACAALPTTPTAPAVPATPTYTG